jgi:hypothetical protein
MYPDWRVWIRFFVNDVSYDVERAEPSHAPSILAYTRKYKRQETIVLGPLHKGNLVRFDVLKSAIIE